MKFSIAITVFTTIVATVSAQVQAPTGNFNVTSPTPNSPYVANQILPCTYQLFQNVDTTGLTMNIDLISSATGTNVSTIHIATNADMSKSSSSAKQNGNITFYEHSQNYPIPNTVTPGSYKVSFSAGGGAPLEIPITILPAAASSSLAAKGSATGTSGSSATGGSIFSGSATSSQLALGSKSLIALAGIVGIAFVV